MNKSDAAYQEKTSHYFENVRHEILPLLPNHADRIFEVGCGAGGTLSFLKSSGRCNWAGGLELFHDAAETARGKLDFVLEGGIEAISLPFEENSMDVILCLDVLEHLVDPWGVIPRLHALLKPGGVLICSIPNARNFRVVLPLLFLGRWQYSRDGLLDKTHLRFFTKKTAIELVECSGLTVDIVGSTGLEKWNKPAAIANMLSLSIFRPFFEFQYLIRAIKKTCCLKQVEDKPGGCLPRSCSRIFWKIGQLVKKVAVILLNWNGWRDTLECLASLDKLDYPNYDVLIVDNASTDESVARIQAAYPAFL